MESEGREFLAELRRLADPDDLPKLLKACLGRRVHFPRGQVFRPDTQSWIKDAIGPEKAEALIRKFARESWISGTIEVPMETAGFYAEQRRQRDALFEKLLAEGKSTTEIAHAISITRRAVMLRKKKIREAKARQKSPSDPTHSGG